MKQPAARLVSLARYPGEFQCAVHGCDRTARVEENAVLILEVPMPGAADLVLDVRVCAYHAYASE